MVQSHNPVRMRQTRKGFTLIELLIVVVIIGILAAIAIPRFSEIKQKARKASLQADLRNLAVAQQAYSMSNATYASTAAAAGLYVSPGNTITINEATAGGWSATATNNTTTCALFYGNASPVAPATTEGLMVCQ